MTPITPELLQQQVDSLTLMERMQLFNGINLEALLVIQKMFPDVPLIADMIKAKTVTK